MSPAGRKVEARDCGPITSMSTEKVQWHLNTGFSIGLCPAQVTCTSNLRDAQLIDGDEHPVFVIHI
jgi:hypothetical protein